ncbi:hypothetical protein GW932_03165 [archaeon]|nr:hypothetical protein [archaeon]
MDNKWYEFFNKSNGLTIAYIKEHELASKYYSLTDKEFLFEEMRQNAEKLEYKVLVEGSWAGTFKYKTHAEKFNQELFKGKGIISPIN